MSAPSRAMGVNDRCGACRCTDVHARRMRTFRQDAIEPIAFGRTATPECQRKKIAGMPALIDARPRVPKRLIRLEF